MEPSRQGKAPRIKTSNNSACVNHVLESAANWKLSDQPTIYRNVVQHSRGTEMNEHAEAIRDCRNYEVHDTVIQHLIDKYKFTNLSQEQKKKRVSKFRMDIACTLPNTVVSSDGRRTMPRTNETKTAWRDRGHNGPSNEYILNE